MNHATAFASGSVCAIGTAKGNKVTLLSWASHAAPQILSLGSIDVIDTSRECQFLFGHGQLGGHAMQRAKVPVLALQCHPLLHKMLFPAPN